MKNLVALLIAIISIQACSKSEFTDTETKSSIANHFDVNESLIDTETFENEGYVLIDGDMLYEKEVINSIISDDDRQRNNDCNRGSISLPFPTGKKGIYWRNNDIDFTYVIHYRISERIPPLWRTATRNAFESWNSLNSNRIRFQEVSCGALDSRWSRGIYVDLLNVPSRPTAIAFAIVGSATNYKRIFMNTASLVFNSNNLGRYERTMVHEIGHSLGYRHTDENSGCLIEGTSDNDNRSIMRSVIQPNSVPIFSQGDITAHNTIYGSVANPVEICYGFSRGCPGNVGSCR